LIPVGREKYMERKFTLLIKPARKLSGVPHLPPELTQRRRNILTEHP
jgi:hypothetical protein